MRKKPLNVSNRLHACLLCVLSSAVLMACGGGGGGSESGGTSADANPPQNVVAPASLSIADAQLIAGRVASLVGMLGSLSLFAELAHDSFSPFAQAQETEACELGGSATRLQSDADGNRTLSAGDSLGLSANACREEGDGDAVMQVDGRYDISVLSVSGMPYGVGSSWTARNRQTYSGFTVAGAGAYVRLDGVAEVEDTARLHTYRFFDISQSGAVATNRIQLRSGEATMEVAGANGATDGGLAVGFKDLVVLTNLSASDKVSMTASAQAASSLRFGVDGVVSAGTLVLQLEKARVVMTVIAPNQVRVDLDNNNDGSIDATQTLAWSALITAAAL